MNPILQEIFLTKKVRMPDGKMVNLTSNISVDEGKMLQDIVCRIKPNRCLEVGCAYGISSLFICESLDQIKAKRHTIIDSGQIIGVNRAGLNNLEKAGYGYLVDFHDGRSEDILPALKAKGYKIDFAFVDGWHTFDHTLIDFFYIDKMLNVGGVVAFDDADWPSVHKVCRYIKTNRHYDLYLSLRPKKYEGIDEFGFYRNSTCIAFIKIKHDTPETRRWDFHRDF